MIYREDVGDTFLRNVGNHIWSYATSQPRRAQSTIKPENQPLCRKLEYYCTVSNADCDSQDLSFAFNKDDYDCISLLLVLPKSSFQPHYKFIAYYKS
jgi:hypothetical protein